MRDDVVDRLVVRQAHRHAAHHHRIRVARVSAADPRLVLLERLHQVPVAGADEARRVQGLVAGALGTVAGGAGGVVALTGAGVADDGGLEVKPLLENLSSRDPTEVRSKALKDDLIRGDLISDDGRVAALVVTFDEDRIDEVRAGVIQAIHEIVDPALPPGIRAHYNGSLEISETYNRSTLDNQRKFTPPIFLITVLAIYLSFRSIRKTTLSILAIAVSTVARSATGSALQPGKACLAAAMAALTWF